MRNILISLFIAALAVCYSDAAWGHPPVRCNGMVQFRPCNSAELKRQSVASGVPRAVLLQRGKIAGKNAGNSEPPLVVEQRFLMISSHRGHWYGTVRGEGPVSLKLLIMRNGKVLSSRYMGSINLRDRSTRYDFKSTLPKEPNWSWRVVAYS